jgi:DNA gyrase subunit A
VLLEILGDRGRVMAIMREELVEVREQFAVPRRTRSWKATATSRTRT